MIQTQKTSEIIQAVKELMQQAGYNGRTINRYNTCWNALLKYEGDDRIFSTGRAINFLDAVYNITAFASLTKTDVSEREPSNIYVNTANTGDSA